MVLHASRYREQGRNLEDAGDRLAELLRVALAPVKQRRPTRPHRRFQAASVGGEAPKERSEAREEETRPMNDDPEEALEKALNSMEAAPAAALGRWDARAVLVPLGYLLQARGEEALAGPLARLRAALATRQENWRCAVDEELSLACAEHVQGTDSRYLRLSNFDWNYLMEARERLQARRIAASALGFETTERLWVQVEEADQRIRELRPAPGKEAKIDPQGP